MIRRIMALVFVGCAALAVPLAPSAEACDYEYHYKAACWSGGGLFLTAVDNCECASGTSYGTMDCRERARSWWDGQSCGGTTMMCESFGSCADNSGMCSVEPTSCN